jgi:hypothetical protein
VRRSRATIKSAATSTKKSGKESFRKKIFFDTIPLNLLNSVACNHISFRILRHEFRRRML